MNSNNRNRRNVKNKKTVKKRKVKHSKLKLFIYFILVEIIVTVASAPWIIYYGPFNTLKKMIVGEAMSTMSHQYLATFFLSQDSINQILYGGKAVQSNATAQNLNDVSVGSTNSKIELSKITGTKYNGLMLIVHDPKRVKVGYSNELGSRGQKPSQIAKEYNAIGAINGGGFSDKGQNSTAIWTGTGAFPTGVIISNGKLVYPTGNIDKNQLLPGVAAITSDGHLIVGKHTLGDLLKDNVQEALCFGPTLIIDGIPQTVSDVDGKPIDSQGVDPRTVIGQRKDGSIVLLTIDGRQGLEAGATIGDLQKILLKAGVVNAVNLDGGASTVLYYKGKVQNSPSDKFGERPVPDIFYVK